MKKITIQKRIATNNTILSCTRWYALQGSLLPDNIVARCAECNHTIQHRPHAPKKIKKVCMECAAPFLTDRDTKLITTQRMIHDAATYFRKQKQ